MNALTTQSLVVGFERPVMDGQQAFRRVLGALSEPGTVHALPLAEGIEAVDNAALAICLSLIDRDTRLWLSPALAANAALLDNLRFHCQCPLVEDSLEAVFALIGRGEMPSLERFNSGCDLYPDRSATLIIQVDSIEPGRGMTLSGPGIDGSRQLAIGGLSATFWQQLIQLRADFPRGLDCLFTCGDRLVAIPRSTQIGDLSDVCSC